MKWLLQTLVVSTPPYSPPGADIQFLQSCSMSFLHFATPEKYTFFLILSDWSNRKHSKKIWYYRPSATTSYWGSRYSRLSPTKPANGNDSAWWHFRLLSKFQLCALATLNSCNCALRRRAGAVGGAAAPSSVATCLIVVFIYFGVQFRSWTYSLIGIKRLVTVTLIEGRI